MTEKLIDPSHDNKSGDIKILPVRIDISHIPASNGAESKIQEMYETVHPNVVLVLLFEHTEAECGKLRSYRKYHFVLQERVYAVVEWLYVIQFQGVGFENVAVGFRDFFIFGRQKNLLLSTRSHNQGRRP